MSEDDELLKALLMLKKSKTRFDIIDALLSSPYPMSADEIAEKIKLNTNATSVALHYLVKQGLVIRVQRGLYEVNLKALSRILLIVLSSDSFIKMYREFKKRKK